MLDECFDVGFGRDEGFEARGTLMIWEVALQRAIWP
jgi:hypothetical protein